MSRNDNITKDGVVLFISNDFPPISGGQSRYLYDLWSCLPAAEIVVMAPLLNGSSEIDTDLPFRVIRVPLHLAGGRFSKLYKTLQILIATLRFCRKNTVRQIHCGQIFSTGFAGYCCCLLWRIPYCIYAHGADLLEFENHPLWGYLLRRILHAADQVVANSKYTQRQLIDNGVSGEKIQIIYPSIDLERFTKTINRITVRKSYGWQDKNVILSMGRLVERKGQDTVIKALPLVAAQVPNIHYAIGGSGPYQRILEQLAIQEGVEKYIEFLGFVDEAELVQRYAAADIFSMISREIPTAGEVEGFGIVYLEANATSTAVIAGRSGGVEDAVADGHSGLLVDPEDHIAVAHTMVTLLQDHRLRHQLISQGKTRVMENFDRQRSAARLWALCK